MIIVVDWSWSAVKVPACRPFYEIYYCCNGRSEMYRGTIFYSFFAAAPAVVVVAFIVVPEN